MAFGHKHILGINELSREDIVTILDTAESFKEINTRDIKKVPTLRGKTIINLFFENSTRTRTSFEIAGKRLSADTVNISASASSVTATTPTTGKRAVGTSPAASTRHARDSGRSQLTVAAMRPNIEPPPPPPPPAPPGSSARAEAAI